MSVLQEHESSIYCKLLVKNSPPTVGDRRDVSSIPGSGRSPGGGHAPTPVFLPGESHGLRSLVGYSPWGHKESDTTEELSTITMYLKEYCDKEKLHISHSDSIHSMQSENWKASCISKILRA